MATPVKLSLMAVARALIFLLNFVAGSSCSGNQADSAATLESTSMLLLGTGLTGVAVAARRLGQ